MRRDLSTLDRDIGQDWSRIIQEAFKHGIDCTITQGGLLPGREVQGIHEVSETQNYLLGSRLITKDGRVFYYAKAGGACKSGYGCKYNGKLKWDGDLAYKAVVDDLTVMLRNDGIPFTKDELYGGYVLIHHATNMQTRRIIGNNASPSADVQIIAAVNKGAAGEGSFEIAASVASQFTKGTKIVVYGSVATTNDGIYTVRADATYDSPTTTITVEEAVAADTTGDGNLTGVVVLTLEEPLSQAFTIASFAEVLPNSYANLSTDGSTTQSHAGVPGTYATTNGFFWVQTWGELWIVPGGIAAGAVGEGSNEREVTFFSDGSINGVKDIDSTVGFQKAGFIIENNTDGTGPPLIMLQIRP